MDVLALTPRGYCHGVVDALKTMRTLVKDTTLPRPITVLGMVVHNKKVVEDFEAQGIKALDDRQTSRLDLLDQITQGTVVFTAHGVSQKVYQKAFDKGLHVIDTTCTDVKASQQTILKHLDDGYVVFFIGKAHHPETETAQSYHSNVILIDSLKTLNNTVCSASKIAVTNQTTMSLFDIYHLTEAIKKTYPQAILIDEQCDATKTRQLAVMRQPKTIDHCFIVGDRRSNNSNKLVEVAQKAGISASLIESIKDLDIDHLKTLDAVSVSSGASTPSPITKEVIRFLNQFDRNNPNTFNTQSNIKQLFKALSL